MKVHDCIFLSSPKQESVGGFDQWIEESGEIRKRYFKEKFIVGKGQAKSPT